ncbi:FMN-dependent NADH-azoreductase [Allosphingosinicella deserti]|uniref:FMN dependent NADH:quinone oxidoreductase n=1 Tax=Allosphingosinicella deserti TaxID=2116704 RepID=A0A2P7QSS2_9SPHN|nr:FMN-dependent NADH-azoreductase [Sphingomonas deserti]PSJ41028.1 FMN-dependent NADH-azoreductase [Sphingomonas deserti]
MTKVLVLDSAATGDASVSRKLTRELVDSLGAREGALTIVQRDIGADPIPHLTAETVTAIRGGPVESDAARAALALSDRLVAELREADLVVIGAPMYNFGIPSTLKAWFDHVLRARVTFQYSEAGPEGLMTGKRAIVVESRAGLYSEGPAAAMDSQEPHLRNLLGFMGITDVTFVRVEKLAFGPEAAEASLAQASEQLRELALAA